MPNSADLFYLKTHFTANLISGEDSLFKVLAQHLSTKPEVLFHSIRKLDRIKLRFDDIFPPDQVNIIESIAITHKIDNPIRINKYPEYDGHWSWSKVEVQDILKSELDDWSYDISVVDALVYSRQADPLNGAS